MTVHKESLGFGLSHGRFIAFKSNSLSAFWPPENTATFAKKHLQKIFFFLLSNSNPQKHLFDNSTYKISHFTRKTKKKQQRKQHNTISVLGFPTDRIDSRNMYSICSCSRVNVDRNVELAKLNRNPNQYF